LEDSDVSTFEVSGLGGRNVDVIEHSIMGHDDELVVLDIKTNSFELFFYLDLGDSPFRVKVFGKNLHE
jgi:hypothetical protein